MHRYHLLTRELAIIFGAPFSDNYSKFFILHGIRVGKLELVKDTGIPHFVSHAFFFAKPPDLLINDKIARVIC